MTTPLAIAAYNTSYTARSPYITPQEYAMAPTAVDASNLVQGGDTQQNQAELVNVIGRASGVADQMVFGAQGCLAATQDIDGPIRLRINRYGVINFPTRYHPILEVDAILIGPTTSTMISLTGQQAQDISINPNGVIEIPIQYITPTGTTPVLSGVFTTGGMPLVQVTYVNGYPTTTLGATYAAGVSTVTVATATGIYPGSVLTIYDDYPNNEPVVVAPTYVQGSTTLPLVSPLLYTHSYGTSVSNLPPAVKQAVIHLTSYLIKTRGALSIVAGKLTSAPSKTTASDSGALKDYNDAASLLMPFQRVR